MMASAVFSRRRWPEEVDGFDFSSSEGEEAHVLAVDDSLVDRKVIEKLLKISSYKVTAVDSGSRALKFLGLDEEEQNSTAVEELKVDLIITDYCMPGMTGYELLKKIKESSAFRDIPVVIMSSENILARIHRCLEEGADDFIVKPVKLSDVKRLKDRLKAKDCVSKIKTLDRTLINNKRKLSDGRDLSTSPTSSESTPSTISSPGSSPSISQSPASTPSPPPSSQSSQSPPLEPPIEPLDSPSRKVKPSTDLDQIIPDSPL